MLLIKTTNRVMASLHPPRTIIMPASSSLSSILPSQHNPHLLTNPTNPNSTPRCIFPPRATKDRFTYCTINSPPPPTPPPVPPPPPEKKSFAVATGELFLGLAARFIGRASNSSTDGVEYPVTMFERTKGNVDAERDDAEPNVVWEQSEKDVEAERERRVVTSPGFSFSAAGLLFPYHIGVAQFLIEKGYIKDTTPLAGSSAGAIICAAIASGASMEDALKATKIVAKDCRLKGTAFRIGAVLRDVLEDFLPDDAHIRSNGRVRVAVTQILWRPRGLLVDHFDSKEDLINALITSSFVPGYLAPKLATTFRNRLCMDGGLTLFMPPTSAAKTVRVCAFPAKRMGLQGIGISPDCNPDNRGTARELFNWALEPADEHVLDRMYELGYLDAAVWAEKNPVEEILKDDCPCSIGSLVGKLSNSSAAKLIII